MFAGLILKTQTKILYWLIEVFITHYTWRNIKSAYNKNKLKISAPGGNDKFDLPDGSYSVSDI